MLERPLPEPLVRRSRPRSSMILKRSVLAPFLRLAGLDLHRESARVGLHAALPPAGAAGAARFTTMCPISPAAPRPSQCLPSRISPPPTPVPHQTPRIVSNCFRRRARTRPGPRPNVVADPHRDAELLGEVLPRGRSRSSPGGCERPRRRPSSRRRRRESPCRRRSARGSRARPARPPRASPRQPRAPRPRGRPCPGVGRRDWPRTLLSASTTTVWILVPPRSIPPRGACFESGLTPQTISGGNRVFAKLPPWHPPANGAPGG